MIVEWVLASVMMLLCGPAFDAGFNYVRPSLRCGIGDVCVGICIYDRAEHRDGVLQHWPVDVRCHES
jgi:hypothetical protein